MYYGDNVRRHMKQVCNRPNVINSKGSNERINQKYAVVDNS